MAKFCAENAESGFCRLIFLLRDTTRQLARHPGFTVAALLSLALGIGASAAIFSLLNALLFRPLPVARPEQLAYVGPASSLTSSAGSSSADASARAPGAVSSLMLAALRDDPEVAGVCGFLPPAATVQYGDARSTTRVSALAFTEDCFETLGIRPAIGRLFDRTISRRQDEKIAVISYDAWQREYQGRADIVGQTLRLEGVLCTIVGVTEPGFAGLVLGFPAQVMYPIAQHIGPPAGAPSGSEPSYVVSAIVRHHPDGSFDRLRAHLLEVWPRLLDLTTPAAASAEERDRYRAQPLVVAPANTPVDYSLRGRFGTPLYVMLGISALVLLFCCVNVANLMLARGIARRREMAIRLAIGATRRTLIRQVTAESIILVVGGVCAGLLVAYAGASALVRILRANYTGLELDATPDARVLLLCSVAAALAVLIAGVLPAWRISDICASDALKTNGRAICSGGRMRKALIEVQMGLTLVLLTGAFLFVQSLRDLRWTDLGFQPAHVVTAQLVPLPGAGGEAPRELNERQDIIERMRSLPGVTGVSLTNTAPLARTTPAPVLLARADADGASMPVNQVVVSNGYFQTLGIPLLQGVDFRTAGSGGAADVIVSQSLARKAFPEGNALGQQLRIASRQRVRTARVIGIAADARIFGPKGDVPPVLYLNFWQAREYQQAPMLLVRTAGEASRMTETVRRAIDAKGSEYATFVRATDAQLDMQLLQERLLAWLATTFGLITLLLAAIGLFGLLSYLVTSRVPEIGLRLALGAPKTSVWRQFMCESLKLTAIGTVAGIGLTLVLASFISHVLNGAFGSIVPPLASTAVVLLVVGALAGLLPASRAARLGVLASLRQE